MSWQPRYNPRHYSTTCNSEMARLQDSVEMAYQGEQVEWHRGDPEMKPESDYNRFERLALAAKPQLDRLMEEVGGSGHAEAPFCTCSRCSRRRAYHVLLSNPYEDEDDQEDKPDWFDRWRDEVHDIPTEGNDEDSDPCEPAQDPPEHQAGDPPAPPDGEDLQD